MMTDFHDHGDESSYEVPGGMRPLSIDDAFRESSLYSRTTRDELPLSTGDMDGASDTDSGSRAHRAYSSRFSEEKKSSYDELVSSDKGLLLKTLIDAESAANSAAIQLVSFKDILDDDFGLGAKTDIARLREGLDEQEKDIAQLINLRGDGK